MKAWLNKLLIEGRIVPEMILRSIKYKEFKEIREENVKNRYDKKRIKKEKKEEYLIQVINGIINDIDPENIYMYNILGKGSGYKYYLGEKVIIYQITNKNSIEEIKEIKNSLNATEIHGINFETHRVRKILITTVKYKVDKDWKKYTIKNEENIFKKLSKI